MPQDCARSDIVCIGLVTGFGSVEAGIEQEAWLALQDAKASGEVDRIDYIETIDTRDRSANLAFFANAGYDIVATTGAGIAEETLSAAERFPDVQFVLIQPGHELFRTPGNLVLLEFHEEHAGFLAGATAAFVTRTRHVAAVCEARFLDYVERYCEGFAAGVHAIDDEVRVTVSYRTGEAELLFRDAEWGQAAAAAAIADGADVVFAVGEGTARAALLEAANRGVPVIAAQTDASKEHPEIVELLIISSTVKVREALRSIIQGYAQGRPVTGTFWGEVGLAPLHGFGNRLPPDAASRLAGMEADLNGGKLIIDLSLEGP